MNTVWAWAALLGVAFAAFLGEFARPEAGSRLTIGRLRREIFCVPARVHRARDGTIWLHTPPGSPLLDRALTALQALPTTG